MTTNSHDNTITAVMDGSQWILSFDPETPITVAAYHVVPSLDRLSWQSRALPSLRPLRNAASSIVCGGPQISPSACGRRDWQTRTDRQRNMFVVHPACQCVWLSVWFLGSTPVGPSCRIPRTVCSVVGNNSARDHVSPRQAAGGRVYFACFLTRPLPARSATAPVLSEITRTAAGC